MPTRRKDSEMSLSRDEASVLKKEPIKLTGLRLVGSGDRWRTNYLVGERRGRRLEPGKHHDLIIIYVA